MNLKSISFNNFKYVPNSRQIEMNFDGSDLIILGGPNGYGKTTIFDAIELLITGKIKHFNENLPNRGKEKISVLANNSNNDIVIIGEFFSSNDNFVIKRIFESKNDFKSLIYINDREITNNQLYEILGINESLFHLGIYVSQMDSLNFLQQKYKSRKEFITDILDNEQIEKRLGQYREIKSGLENKFKLHEEKIISELKKIEEDEVILREKIKEIQLSEEKPPYVRLFPNKKFNFDKEVFEQGDNFDTVISPLNELIKYTKLYEDFLIKKRNLEAEKYLELDKKMYITEYYSNEIQLCNDNFELITKIKTVQTIKQDYEDGKFNFNEEVASILDVDDTLTARIKELILSKINIEKNMNETESLISDLLNKRHELINTFDLSARQGSIAEDGCPLCGRTSVNLRELFDKTEESLKSSLGLVADSLKEVLKELDNIFKVHIIDKIDELVSQNKDVFEKFIVLNSYLSVDSSDLDLYLTRNNIKFKNNANTVDFTTFEQEYSSLIDKIEGFIKPEKAIISNEIYTKFQQISLEYYNQGLPYDEKVLLTKKLYVASVFSNTLNYELQTLLELHKEKNKIYEQQKGLYNNDMSTLFWTVFYRTIYLNFLEFICKYKIIYLIPSRVNKLAIARP